VTDLKLTYKVFNVKGDNNDDDNDGEEERKEDSSDYD